MGLVNGSYVYWQDLDRLSAASLHARLVISTHPSPRPLYCHALFWRLILIGGSPHLSHREGSDLAPQGISS